MLSFCFISNILWILKCALTIFNFNFHITKERNVWGYVMSTDCTHTYVHFLLLHFHNKTTILCKVLHKQNKFAWRWFICELLNPSTLKGLSWYFLHIVEEQIGRMPIICGKMMIWKLFWSDTICVTTIIFTFFRMM